MSPDPSPRKLRAPRITFQRLERIVRRPAVLASLAAALVLSAFAIAAILSGQGPSSRGVIDLSPSPSPTQAIEASPSASPTSAGVSPAPTVAGMQALDGTLLVDTDVVASSADVPSAPPAATPTPTSDPAVWRFEGRIVDIEGHPIVGACVVIGPNGCRQFSPHTDDRGVYSIDLPQNPSIVYELRFQMQGFVTTYAQARPKGPTVFNIVLRRA